MTSLAEAGVGFVIEFAGVFTYKDKADPSWRFTFYNIFLFIAAYLLHWIMITSVLFVWIDLMLNLEIITEFVQCFLPQL